MIQCFTISEGEKMKNGWNEKGRRKRREEWKNSKRLCSEEQWEQLFHLSLKFQSPHLWMNFCFIINFFLFFKINILSLLFCDSNILPMCHNYQTFKKGVTGDLLKPLVWGSWKIIDPFFLSTFIALIALNMLTMHAVLVYLPHCANSTRWNFQFHLTYCHRTKTNAEW